MNNYFRLIVGICVFSRATMRVVFGAAYSARMTMMPRLRPNLDVYYSVKHNQPEVSRTFRGMRDSEKNMFFANQQKQSSFLYSK